MSFFPSLLFVLPDRDRPVLRRRSSTRRKFLLKRSKPFRFAPLRRTGRYPFLLPPLPSTFILVAIRTLFMPPTEFTYHFYANC